MSLSRTRGISAVALVLLGVLVAALVAGLGSPSPSEPPSAASSRSVEAAPSGKDAPAYTDGNVPYSNDSVWNTPIPADAEVDPRSAEFVATILEGSEAVGVTSDPTQYTYPVYLADASTPRFDLACRQFKCTVLAHENDSNPLRVDELTDVPIPAGARSSSGSDSSMIVIDTVTGAEYDLWQAEQEGDSWSVSNGSVYNVTWDAEPVEYGSRGAGIPYLAGLVRHWEISAGEINHAIAFAYINVAADGCVWPASKTDGRSELAAAMPEGTRLQLDPTLDDADWDELGLDRTGRIIARALQTYGMILVDVSGRPKLMLEDLSANPFSEASWDDPSTPLTDQTVAAIPIDSFRVLALPEGYSNLSPDGARHGSCYR